MDTKNIFKKKGRVKGMKIRMRYIYGIVLLLLLGVFVGCASKDVKDEGAMGTPEGVVLAYLNGFAEEDFSQIESMLIESDDVGDVYFTQSQQPPKDTLEMIESQHEFITHFYGDDAWSNVEYELEEIMLGSENLTDPDSDVGNNSQDLVADDSDSDVDNIKEYRVDFVFKNMPRHLMGFENINILLSNESGAWVIKEGLSWDKNLYGGGPAPEYFKGSEATYRGINKDMEPEDVIRMLGQPMAQGESDEDGYLSYFLDYSDASYYFSAGIEEYDELDRYYIGSIIIKTGNYSLPRDIKLGDTFYNTMDKFPRDKDWLTDPNNCFYGTNTLDGFGGACFSHEDEDGNTHDSLVFVPMDYVPYMKLEFTNNILKTGMIVFMQMQ